jgi:cell division transport system permease protein
MYRIKLFIISQPKRTYLAKYRVSHPGFYLFSLVSLSILLVLSGFLLTGLFFSDYYTKKFKEEIRLLAELQMDMARDVVDQTLDRFEKIDGIKKGSIKFISRDEALSEMYGDLGEGVMIEDAGNPFSDMIEFSIEADRFDKEFVEELANKIEKQFPVTQVHYPADYFDDVFGVLKTARSYMLIFVIVAMVMTGVLIHHIMRLNVIAQQRQIRTMELVGAKASFIRRPFIRRGLKMGVQAWVVAVVLSGIAWYYLLGLSMFTLWLFSLPGLIGVVMLLCLSVVICTFSTWIAVMKSMGSSILQSS